MYLKRGFLAYWVLFASVQSTVKAEGSIDTQATTLTLSELKCFEEAGYRLSDVIQEIEKSYDQDQEFQKTEFNEAPYRDQILIPRPGGGQTGGC